jgi:hypothetical protein
MVSRLFARPSRLIFGRTNDLDYVGTGWKQRLIERILGISGRIFYHAVLRPKDQWDQRKKNKNENRKFEKPGT